MATYKIDAMHSEIAFKIKHLMISTVTGRFTAFDATMTSDNADFSDAKITFEAEINSISTGNDHRDTHLKGADFFAADEFPKLTFSSTAFTKKGGDDYVLVGDLTMHGVTKSVELAVKYNGGMTDFYGNNKIGFEIEGKIKRSAFGLTWSGVTEAGGVVVSDDVKLELDIQLAEQK
jgi:polyisoprenoid-binding protein YceI